MNLVRSLVLTSALSLPAMATQATAQGVLKPLDVAKDSNGVDLLSGKIQTRAPVVSAPGASQLRFTNLQDLQPFLEGVLSAGSVDNRTSYSVNNGSSTSESFTCTDNGCPPSTKRLGSTLIADNAGKVFEYYQGGTGTKITFNLQNNQQGAIVGNARFHFYPSSIQYANGETLTFSYDSYTHPTIGVQRRPSQTSSNLGYSLTLAWNAPMGQLGWTDLAQVTMRGPDNSIVSQNTYSGNTVTDLAGRVFTCTGCTNWLGGDSSASATTLRLPMESVDTLNAINEPRTYGSITHQNWVTKVISDGVEWNYAYVPGSSVQSDISKVTITGPLSFSRVVNIEKVTSTARPRIRTEVDSLGRTTSYDYDDAVRVTKITYPETNSASVIYDDMGNITESRLRPKTGSGLTDLVETAYYPRAANCQLGAFCNTANVFKPDWTRDAKNQQTDYTWTSNGLLLTKLEPADASGKRRKTINEYTGSRLLRERICATNSAGVELTCGTNQEIVREFTYWGLTFLPLTETVKDGTGGQARTTSFTYDAAGRLLSSDGPLSGTNDATYNRFDASGRRTWEIGPKGGNGLRLATRTTYREADDQPLTVERGSIVNSTDTVLDVSSIDYLTYDLRRKPIKKRSAAFGNDVAIAQISYDARNREACNAVRMNPAAWASLPADACSLGTTGNQGADRITRTSYDPESRVTLIEKAVGTPLRQDYAAYGYTVNGKREFITDANGNKAKFQFDGHDRQTHWWFPSKATVGSVSSTDYEQYGYDASGNRTTLRKRDGRTLTFTYDAMNRMTSKLVPDGCAPIQVGACTPVTATRDVFYGYDIQGRQLTAKYDAGAGADGLTNVYDVFGNLTSSTISMGGFSKTLTNLHDVANRRTRLTHPDGNSFTYTHDAADRLGGVYEGVDSTVPLATFTYNGQGLTGARSERLGSSVGYGYDGLGRLTSITDTFVGGTGNVARSFAYTPASQLASQTSNNDSYAWTGHAEVDRTYSVNGLNQYAAVGAATYTYDANGNLTGDGATTYVYDAENRLVSHTTGGVTANLTWDPMGRLWQLVKGTADTRFLYDGDALIVEYDGAGAVTNRHVHDSNATADNPLIWYQGSGLTSERWLHADHLGSIVAISSTTGGSPTINSYDEFGIPSTTATGLNVAGRFAYTGQAWLAEIGLYHYKARFYSPLLGRFLQTDPIGYEDQINLYTYVENDPINGRDPKGTDSVWVYPDKIIVVVPVINQSHLSDDVVLKGFQISGQASDGTKVYVTAASERRIDSVVVTTTADSKETRSYTDSIGGRQITLSQSANGNTVRHEAGHTLGAGDQYKGGIAADSTKVTTPPPGSAGSLMRDDTSEFRQPNTQSINEVKNQAVTSQRNRIYTCKPGQKPSACSN